MLSEKAGVRVAGNKVSNSKQARMTAKNPRTNKTFMSTAQSTKNPQESSFQNEGDFVRNEEERNLTKSAIMNRAWENSQVAE